VWKFQRKLNGAAEWENKFDFLLKVRIQHVNEYLYIKRDIPFNKL
jgi:hypothetical protein